MINDVPRPCVDVDRSYGCRSESTLRYITHTHKRVRSDLRRPESIPLPINAPGSRHIVFLLQNSVSVPSNSVLRVVLRVAACCIACTASIRALIAGSPPSAQHA